MKLIQINPNAFLNLPDDYEKIPLPYFTERVEALNSGKFFQGFEELWNQSSNTFCYLGVLLAIQNRFAVDIDRTNLQRFNP